MHVDLWGVIVSASANQTHLNGLKGLLEATDQLSVEEKAELVKHLVKSGSLSVVLGNQHLSAQVVIQINTMDREGLADILQAVADRISSGQEKTP
jgi:ABC-type uncharacterized transport system permease subunit